MTDSKFAKDAAVLVDVLCRADQAFVRETVDATREVLKSMRLQPTGKPTLVDVETGEPLRFALAPGDIPSEVDGDYGFKILELARAGRVDVDYGKRDDGIVRVTLTRLIDLRAELPGMDPEQVNHLAILPECDAVAIGPQVNPEDRMFIRLSDLLFSPVCEIEAAEHLLNTGKTLPGFEGKNLNVLMQRFLEKDPWMDEPLTDEERACFDAADHEEGTEW